MAAGKHLVLVDIDGTLVWPDGAGREALRAALRQVYGTTGPIDGYQFGGFTDRRTVGMLMREAGLPEDTIWGSFDSVAGIMTQEMRMRILRGDHQVKPCPGALALIEALRKRHDSILGLITGNFRETAQVKLEAAGFDPGAFVLGVYGDASADRADLPALAVEQSRLLTGQAITGERIVIIGDTTHDILCGRAVGARSIAVLTGWSNRDEILACNPDYVFDDLTDLDAVLEAIFAPCKRG